MNQKMRANIFREYDIRAVVDREITDDDVVLLGRALGTYYHGLGIGRITLGRDCRLSADRYRGLLLEGLLSTGCHVLDIGTCPTPLSYFSLWHCDVGGSVMITASHNPPQYNGFKISVDKTTIYGKEIQKIYQLTQKGEFVRGRGGVEQVDIITPYWDYVAENLHLERRVSLAVDAGNGTAGPVALPLMERLGLKPHPLYCEMDGNFPNHEPDPTVMENLEDISALVREKNLELGVAYDGDSDRVGVVDEKGRAIFGDMLLAIFARAILAEEKGGTFIGEVKCSKLLFDDIKKHGGNPVMWKAGHSLMKQKMKETGALLAGEMSGHMFFNHRWPGFDDGIYASLRLIELVSKSEKPLSTWLDDMPKTFSTPEIRVECADEIKFQVVEKVKQAMPSDLEVIDVDGVRVNYPDGWGLVRASNTQPALVLRFEAGSENRRDEIRDMIEGEIEKAKASL